MLRTNFVRPVNINFFSLVYRLCWYASYYCIALLLIMHLSLILLKEVNNWLPLQYKICVSEIPFIWRYAHSRPTFKSYARKSKWLYEQYGTCWANQILKKWSNDFQYVELELRRAERGKYDKPAGPKSFNCDFNIFD